ncbi:unnamed protein product [Phaeothamnion confervicola]
MAHVATPEKEHNTNDSSFASSKLQEGNGEKENSVISPRGLFSGARRIKRTPRVQQAAPDTPSRLYESTTASRACQWKKDGNSRAKSPRPRAAASAPSPGLGRNRVQGLGLPLPAKMQSTKGSAKAVYDNGCCDDVQSSDRGAGVGGCGGCSSRRDSAGDYCHGGDSGSPLRLPLAPSDSRPASLTTEPTINAETETPKLATEEKGRPAVPQHLSRFLEGRPGREEAAATAATVVTAVLAAAAAAAKPAKAAAEAQAKAVAVRISKR